MGEPYAEVDESTRSPYSFSSSSLHCINNVSSDLPSVMSPGGKFSYAALVSLAMHKLFDNQWDREFCSKFLTTILDHLHIDKNKAKIYFENLMRGAATADWKYYEHILQAEGRSSVEPASIIKDLLSIVIREGKYDSRLRVLIHEISKQLNVPLELVDAYELLATWYLKENTWRINREEEIQMKKQRMKRKIMAITKITLATVGGAALMALSGGLSTPLIATELAALFGTSTVTATALGPATAVMSSLFGAAGAGIAGSKMSERVKDVKEFCLGVLSGDPKEAKELHVAIAVSGWIVDKSPDNFRRPWKCLSESREQYYVRYESEALLAMGEAMDLTWSTAFKGLLMFTGVKGVASVISPANVVKLASIIDNPWSVCCTRSVGVGICLAELLLSRELGERPVTLIGYGMGARVIFYCLREMSLYKDCEGIVHDAILLGAPVSLSKEWDKLTRVVAGRIVNGYSENDCMLRFVYRALSLTKSVAGLEPIKVRDRRFVNVDLSDIVRKHSDYSEKMEEILKKIDVKTTDSTTFISRDSQRSSSDTPVGSGASAATTRDANAAGEYRTKRSL